MNIIRDALWLMTLCLCGCGLAMAGSVSYTLTPDLSTFSLTDVKGGDGNDYTRIVWPGMDMSTEEGKPELPVQYLTFLVPTFSTNYTVEVETRNSLSFNIPHHIFPVQPLIPNTRVNENSNFLSYSKGFYSEYNNPYGFIVEEQMISGRYHTVTVGINLSAYSAESSTIAIFSNLVISLYFRDCSQDEMNLIADLSHPHILMFPLSKSVINPEDESKMVYPINSDKIRATSLSYRSKYLIVAPKIMCDACRSLALWKQQKGYEVEIRSIESIYQEYPPNGLTGSEDRAACLRTFLKDYYDNCREDLYVLLVGNPVLTPMPIRYHPTYIGTSDDIHTDSFTPTEGYFSNVSMPWEIEYDSKNNEYISNINSWLEPEIMVGRLLANNKQDIQNYTNKLILYESNPGRGDNEYLQNAFIFEQDALNGSMLGKSAVVRDTLSHHYNVTLFQDQRNATSPMNWPQGKDVIREMRKNGFNSWHGHGNPAYTSVCAGIHPTGIEKDNYKLWYGICALEEYDGPDRYGGCDMFTKREGEGLDNLGNKDQPSIIYSISCDNAPLDTFKPNGWEFSIPYSLGASFTLGENYGGPAFLGNARFGYIGTSEKYEELFLKNLFENPCIGKAQNASKKCTYSNHIRHTHYLNGDPEFNVWIAKPKEITYHPNKMTSSSLSISGASLAKSTISRFDGQGHSILYKDKSLIQFHTTVSSNEFISSPLIAYGIWRPHYLPILSLRNCQGTIKDGTFSFIVREAYLGYNEVLDYSIPGRNCDLQLEGNVNINVQALDSIIVGNTVTLNDTSKMDLSCENMITISGITMKGVTELKIEGRITIIESDFIMEPGTKLTITSGVR